MTTSRFYTDFLFSRKPICCSLQHTSSFHILTNLMCSNTLLIYASSVSKMISPLKRNDHWRFWAKVCVSANDHSGWSLAVIRIWPVVSDSCFLVELRLKTAAIVLRSYNDHRRFCAKVWFLTENHSGWSLPTDI